MFVQIYLRNDLNIAFFFQGKWTFTFMGEEKQKDNMSKYILPTQQNEGKRVSFVVR